MITLAIFGFTRSDRPQSKVGNTLTQEERKRWTLLLHSVIKRLNI